MTQDISRKTLAAAGLAVGGLAAVALPGNRLGLNAVAVWLTVVLTVWVGVGRGSDLWSRSFLVLGTLPVFLALMFSAPWVLALEFVAALVTVAVGVAQASAWRSVAAAPLQVLARLHRGFVLVIRPVAEGIARHSPALRPALRTSFLSAGLLLVFGGLLMSADAAFASLTQKWLVPNLDISLLPSRVLVAVTAVATVGSLALLSPLLQESQGSPWVLDSERRLAFRLRPSEWKTGLVVLNLLFAAFVAVQVAVLFGDHAHVLETTGLTYAQYARSGFFQLLWVAILTLGVIAAVARFGDHEQDRRWMVVLLGTLCALTLVILASAFIRMDLYQEAYGATRLRLLVDLSIYWLAGLFLLVMVAGILWNARWMPRAVVLCTVFAVIGFGVSNPDARIARRNLERFDATGKIDLAYLSGLSADAVPVLLDLRHPQAGCTIEAILDRSEAPESLWSFNLGRRRARDLPRPVCRP